uniref:Uncharacterized protein n=1 Tax=Arundo donax TaxID=35708 RepID=A0A0A8ZRX9_ARUDO
MIFQMSCFYRCYHRFNSHCQIATLFTSSGYSCYSRA